MEKKDYKKLEKDLYFPKTVPNIVDVPGMKFIMVTGEGDPNTSLDYKNAINVLYGLSYTIKMGNKKRVIDGYYDYSVYPLEGFWSGLDGYFDYDNMKVLNKNNFKWTAFIRQPEFVTDDIFNWALGELKNKKKELDYSNVKFEVYEEGLCVEVMHIGSYDSEPISVLKMNEYIKSNGYESDFANRLHHEIYLSDPRKTKLESLKTVIRHPIKKIK